MKRIAFSFPLILVSFLFFTSSCGSKQDKDYDLPAKLVTNPGSSTGEKSPPMAKIEFNKLEHDFGILKEGDRVFWNFRFVNEGDADLVINRVRADCGCTVPEYPRNPIKPGEEGTVKITFDTKGRSGRQIRNITVLSNSERPTTVLTLSAIIE